MTRSTSAKSSSVTPSAEHRLSTNCCERYWTRGESRKSSISTWRSSFDVWSPASQVSRAELSPRWSFARRMKERSLRWGKSAYPPAAMISANAVLPEPRAPMMPTRPAFKGTVAVFSQGALVTETDAITWDGKAPRGGTAPMNVRVSGSRQV